MPGLGPIGSSADEQHLDAACWKAASRGCSSADEQHLDAAFQQATRAVIERWPGRRAFVLYGDAMAPLRKVLRLARTDAPRATPYQVTVRLERGAESLGTVVIHNERAIGWTTWLQPAAVADPAALGAWLRSMGLSDGEEVVTADPAAGGAGAPSAIVPFLDRLRAPGANVGDFDEALKALRADTGGGDASVWALCAWLSGGETNPVGQRLLRELSIGKVIDAAVSGVPEHSRVGLASWLAANVRTRAADLGRRLPEPVRDALLEATNAQGQERLSAALGAERLAPEGMTPVAVAKNGRLRRLCRDGTALYAIDGVDLARFEGGQRSVLTALPNASTPLAVRKGEVWYEGPDDRLRSISTQGGDERVRRGPLFGLPQRRLRGALQKFAAARDAALTELIASGHRLLTLDLDEDACDAYASFGGDLPGAGRGFWACDVDGHALWEVDGAVRTHTLEGRPLWIGRGSDPDGALVIIEGSDGGYALWAAASGEDLERVVSWGEGFPPVGAFVEAGRPHLQVTALLGECVVA